LKRALPAPYRQTEAAFKQLLHLMIHSLYSNREIFLRELISNASDACDKLRFEALPTRPARGRFRLKIRVAFDKAARTLTIADNGIGMSREEVIAHLGTIAKSGTASSSQADRRPAEGRQPDRPVRRRLLLGLHRGRQGHRASPAAPAPPAGRALGIGRRHGGEFTVETVERPRAAPRSCCT
jgi:hypothetical protein